MEANISRSERFLERRRIYAVSMQIQTVRWDDPSWTLQCLYSCTLELQLYYQFLYTKVLHRAVNYIFHSDQLLTRLSHSPHLAPNSSVYRCPEHPECESVVCKVVIPDTAPGTRQGVGEITLCLVLFMPSQVTLM